MSYQDALQQFIRRDVLRVLAQSSSNRIHKELLLLMLAQLALHPTSRELKREVDWLENRDLIRVEQIANISIYQLTETGRQIGEGLRNMEGIARHAVPG